MQRTDELSHQELQTWKKEGRNFFLVDVREAHEREAWNIGGLHIPLGELLNRSDELPEEQALVFYCRKGIRSRIALQRLAQKQPELIGYNLSGGIGSGPEDLSV